MLPGNTVVAEPNLLGMRVRLQVINVPVRTVRRLQMVRESGAETTGTVGAPDVHVDTGLKPESTEPPDPDERNLCRREDEGIGSWLRLDHSLDYTRLGTARAGLRPRNNAVR
jgi:hypothetical protein